MAHSRSTESRDTDGRTTLVVGVVLWLVSWFVPVFSGQDLLGGLGKFADQLGTSPEHAATPLDGPDWLPGWMACHFAWQLLVDPPQDSKEPRWQQVLCGASCLTNAVMALAVLYALMRRRGVLLGLALLACAGIDSSWLWVSDGSAREWLRPGYYLWLASFPLAGAGLLLHRDQ